MNTGLPPLTVIGGYLGAGKTTLLNDLLCNAHDQRIALVINDFGDINIDAELIASVGAETIALANGCLCCTLVDGLATVLAGLRKRAGTLDHIVVEASGVSDPLKIGHSGAAFGFPLAGVIVVVDAERVRELAVDKYVGETVIRQVRCADLLVVNKTDLVTTDQLASVRRWLGEMAPRAGIAEACRGQLLTSIVLGPNRDSGRPIDDPVCAPHPQYESWSFETGKPLVRSGIDAFLSALPPGILRAKGLLRLADDPDHQYVLQVVGRRSSLTRSTAGDVEQGASRVVVIGTPGSIDRVLLGELLEG